MAVKKLDVVRFALGGKDNFYDAVEDSVKNYFESNQISPYANSAMWFKTAIMLLLFFGPYALIVTGIADSSGLFFFGMWFLMGLGMVGIGTSVMHDANHGTYSANKKVNNWIGHILEVIGGYAVTWKIQHNVLHHTYTNVSGHDDDIDSIVLLRFSPHQPRYWFHRYQYLYAWFFYMLMTLYWMTVKDFQNAVRYNQRDLLIKQKVSLKQAFFRISIFKIGYYSYIMMLPILISDMPWYFVVLGFLVMHFTAGLILSCIFQPAHIVDTSGFAAPIESEGKKKMENSWAMHEVANTSNFAPNNRFLTWFIGGLNYQIEHHLFTEICHVHYPRLAPIVKSATASYGVPYHEAPSFRNALLDHARMLKKLGRA